MAIKLKEDINEIISYQSNEIRKLNEKLLQASSEMDAFSYTIAHDLKTPLAAIHSYTQLLLELYTGRIDNQGFSFLEKIIEKTRKLNQMIEDILKYTKSSTEAITKTRVDAKCLFEDIMDDFSYYKNGKPLFIIKDTPDICGDPTMVKQIFQNVIGNSIKYSSDTGKVAKVEIDGWNDNDKVVFTVKDNGIGIDMKDADKIFDIFTRLHDGKYEGHGVGLSIVKRLVERHDGKIWLESQQGQGSKFYISFPHPS
jgi:two-component system, chemotaxis family, sensor kinase Cph1